MAREDADPMGDGIFGLDFYKDVAPTAPEELC
jgi:hypothetical protein